MMTMLSLIALTIGLKSISIMKNIKPLFSIIVPVYNAEHFITDTIENLLCQKVSKEIILINDGSTDKSIDILRMYETKYEPVRVIDKKNGGVSSTRNVGIEAATGKYIIFVDSDDFIDETILERSEKIFNTYDVDSVFFSYQCCYPGTGKEDFVVNYKATGMYSMNHWLEDFYNLSKTSIINCIGTTIYKLDILNKFHIRFNESISYYEDIGFCTEYMCHIESLYYINEPIYWYRFINSNSLITKYKVNFVQSLWYLRSKQLKLFDSFCDIEKSQLYKVWGDQLVANIINLISHLDKSAPTIDADLSKLSSFPELKLCIKNSQTLRKYILLSALLHLNVSQQKKFYKSYFIIIKNLKSLVLKCLKR